MIRCSICMATYNGERYIQQQLASILPQLGPDDELVISDDSSTDSTVDIIQQIGDPKVRLLVNGQYRSPVYNIENALRHSRGAFIFLADQDDVWLEGKISRMLTALQTCEMVACDCKVVDQDLNVLHDSFFAWIGAKPGFLRTLQRNLYVGNCMAFRRSLLDRALPFPSNLPMHDWWLGLLAEAFGKVCLLREPLVLFRRHSGAASTSFAASERPMMTRITDRVRLLFLVGARLMRAEAR